MSFNLNQNKDKLFFVPLGGSGEIGLNINLYHLDGKWLMVDLGAGFADDYLPGVDIIVPNINFIEQYKDSLVGLVLTHAHEDHVGAVTYLWEQLKMPIYATPFTAAFLKAKFVEKFGTAKHVKIKEVPLGRRFKVSNFDIEYVSLNHSAPEMQALFIRTEQGNVFHTGDWKFDHDPIIGKPNDEAFLEKLGEEGVDVVIGDSTNVFNKGSSGSEGDLKTSLEKLVAECKGMVAVTTFASNLARIETVISAARKSGRKLVVSGRSLWRIIRAAQDSGYLDDLPDLVDERSITNYPRHRLLLLCTGCQGEPLAATTKIATQNHQNIRLIPGDTVIFSSKIIPGNEKAIFRLFNMFVKLGIEVMTEKDHFVHVSGHPGKNELEKMYKLLRPKTVIPVHGELIHMHEHAKIAREIGVPAAVEVENGDMVHISKEGCRKVAVVEAGRLAVDGARLLPTNSQVIRHRRKLRDDGVVICNIAVDQKYRLLNQPNFRTYGVLDDANEKQLIEIITQDIAETIENRKAIQGKKMNESDLDNALRATIRRYLSQEVGKSPLIDLHIDIIYL